MTTVVELTIASPTARWEALGLTVVNGVARVGGIALRFTDASAGDHDGDPAGDPITGVTGWTLAGAPDATITSIDGLPTSHGEPPTGDAPVHRLAIHSWDHLVVMTSSLERTCAAIEAATAAPLKRVREAGAIRQGFHRLGELIIEVVESPQVQSPAAAFWGFVWNVADLHEVCEQLGPDLIGLPKAAVQPGRFIATVRSAAGLGVPLALMTP